MPEPTDGCVGHDAQMLQVPWTRLHVRHVDSGMRAGQRDEEVLGWKSHTTTQQEDGHVDSNYHFIQNVRDG
jgi:hypothetical protein